MKQSTTSMSLLLDILVDVQVLSVVILSVIKPSTGLHQNHLSFSVMQAINEKDLGIRLVSYVS